MDLMATMVDRVVSTDYQRLPPEAVTAARRAIIDTVGVMLAGSSAPVSGLVADAIGRLGSGGDTTIAVFGRKAPANMAVLANATLARAMDIDDVTDAFPLHPGVIVVPPALAMCEQRVTTGRELVAAVAVGQDLLIRLAYATGQNPVFSGRYNLFRVFGATAAAGRLLGLDREQMANAMGLAYCRASGETQAFQEGTMSLCIQEGAAAQAGVESALYAREGITGSRNILEGPRGFYGAFEPEPRLDALTDDLGVAFRGVDISIKPYASCRSSHAAVDLALGLANEHGLELAKIAGVTVRVNSITHRLTCDPLEQKLRPKNQSEAQFSLPFIVAAALIRGDFFIDELTDVARGDEEILRLATRVKPVLDPECETGSALGTTVMEIETSDGQRFSATKAFPKGNPKNPMSLEDCLEKFRKCARYACRPFPDSQLDEIVEMLSNLEDLQDTRELVRSLVPLES